MHSTDQGEQLRGNGCVILFPWPIYCVIPPKLTYMLSPLFMCAYSRVGQSNWPVPLPKITLLRDWFKGKAAALVTM